MDCQNGYIQRPDGTCEFVGYVQGDWNVDGAVDRPKRSNRGNFFNWYDQYGDKALSIVDRVQCLIVPKRCLQQAQQAQATGQPVVIQQNNTILYVFGGVLLLLLFILILKK